MITARPGCRPCAVSCAVRNLSSDLIPAETATPLIIFAGIFYFASRHGCASRPAAALTATLAI
jgi:hypothetical protein